MKNNFTHLSKLTAAFVAVMVLCLSGLSTKAQVSAYSFTSTSGTYTTLSSPTSLYTGTTDDAISAAITLPFSFTLGTNTYTTAKVNSNGTVYMGSGVTSTTNYNAISNALASNTGSVSGWGRDLQGKTTTGAIGYQTLGTSPNRQFVVQWTDYRNFGGATTQDYDFQIILNETSNVVQVIYNNLTSTTTVTGQVGLRGATNADYNNRTSTTSWSASAAGTANTQTMSITSTVFPASGLTYTWTPPVVCSGTPATPVATGPANACPAPQTFVLTSTGATVGGGMTNQWQVDGGGTCTSWTNIAGATNPNSATVSQSTASCYRLYSYCANSALDAVSNTVSVGMNSYLNCYPSSSATSTADEEILNVTVAALNNSSTCATLAPGPGSVTSMYSNYTTLTPTVLYQDISYSISLNLGYCGTFAYSNVAAVWIDYNQNAVFTDAGEQVYIKAYGPMPLAGGVVTGYFTVPLAALTGNTRMRVVYVESSVVNSSGTYTWGETEDYMIDIQTPTACAGTPNTATTTASPTLVCPGTSIFLNTTGLTIAAGYTYQWQANNATLGAWTNLPAGGITVASGSVTQSALSVTNQTITTDYRLVVTCTNSGLSAPSTPVTVTQELTTNCYCNSSATSTADEEIFNVTINTLNNSSTCATLAPGPGSVTSMYSNYKTLTPTDIEIGSTYSLSLTLGYCGSYAYTSMAKVFIDYNIDGDFADAGETVVTSPYQTWALTGTVYTSSITIPNTATAGNTVMRVVFVESSTVNACGTYTWGETEDYMLNLQLLPACTGAPTAGTTTSSDANPCSGIPFTLTAPGTTTGVGMIARQWQIASACAGPWTDIAGAVGVQHNYTFTTAQTRMFRLRSICTVTADTVYSTCLTLTSTLCYCAPSHTTGTGTGFYINRVEVENGGLNNTTGPTGSSPWWDDLTGTVAPGTMMVNAPYWINVETGSNTATHDVGVWIDYNQDGDFVDANEFIQGNSLLVPGGGTATGTGHFFTTVPLTALTGTTRMRVRASGGTTATLDPCLSTSPNYVNGESEDYAINIVANACVTPTQAGFITSINPSQTVVNDYIGVTQSGAQGTLTGWEIDWTAPYDFTPANSTLTNYGGNFIANVNPATPTGFIYIRAKYQNGGCPVDYSNDAFVKLNCASSSTYNTSDNDDIARVILGTGGSIFDNNQGSWPNTHDATLDGYQNYTANGPYNVSRNVAIPFQVGVSTSWSQGVRAWVDYDGDGILTSTESVYVDAATATGLHPLSSITIPCGNGYTGPAILRVMNTFAAIPNADPCFGTITGARGYGEIEEYTLYIDPNPSLTITPSNAVCIGLNNNLTVSGGTGTYTWAPATGLSATTGTTVTATTGGTPIFYTVSGTGPNGCAATGIVAVASTPVGGVVTPVNKVVCSGSSQVFTVTGAAGNLQWQTSPDGIIWSDSGPANAGTTFTLTGVTTNTYVRVIAKTTSCWDISSSTGLANVSATPTITFTNVTATSVTVSWTPTGTNDWTITWTGAGSGTQANPSNPFTITPLTSNTNLSVTIQKTSLPACTGTNNGVATTKTLCAVPTGITVIPVTYTPPVGSPQQGIKATWTAVAGATTYRVYYRPITMNSNWITVDTAGTTKTIIPLYAGVPYAVMVAAYNCPTAGQLGQTSAIQYFTYTNPAPVACGPIPTVTAVSNCPNQITVNITGGSVWRLSLRRISPSYTAGVTYNTSTATNNFSVATSAAGVGTVWEVFAQTNCTGVYSQISNVVTVNVKPTCPAVTNVVISHPTCTGFTVSWNPSSCFSLPLSNYQVYIKKATATNYISYNAGLADHFTFTFLQPNTSYNVFMRTVACNGAVSPNSDIQTFSTGGPGCRTSEDETTAVQGDNNESILLYPNPTNGDFNIDIARTDVSDAAVTIEVVNALGQVMQTELTTMTGGHLNQFVQVSNNIASGVYMVRTTVGANTYTSRLVVQKD